MKSQIIVQDLKGTAIVLFIITMIVTTSVIVGNIFTQTFDSEVLYQHEAIRAGVATIDDDGNFHWAKPKVQVLEIEKQIIVKVPEIKYVEVEKPVVVWQQVHKAMAEYNHEQTVRQNMIEEAMIDAIELETGLPVDEAIKVEEKLTDKSEKKPGFFTRLFKRKKKQD